MKIGKYRIPFQRDNEGRMSLMEYTTSDEGDVSLVRGIYSAHEWRANEPFDATVKLDGHWRGRSAARIGVRNVKNQEGYSLGLAAFYEAVAAFGVNKGEMRGRWVFRKQGANYGLYPFVEEP